MGFNSMTRPLDFCCPQCKGALDLSGDAYSCLECGRKYPVVLGIPDFRVFPDPYIDYEDDYKKAQYLADQSAELDFKGLVELYWKITPEVSKDRSDRFIRRTLALVDKGFENLEEIEALTGKYRQVRLDTVLEIGCGTGGFLVAAKEKFRHAIGIDIAFRWLVVARKRFEELGLEVPLVCCCAEHLPFQDERFDLVFAEDVLEHLKDQQLVLRECYRVLEKKGVMFLATPNRFSLTVEPHVRVWGVGFLPRKWMNGYVKFVKGISYDHIKPLSYVELKNLLKRCAFADERIFLPTISREELKDFSTFEKFQVAIYDVVRKTPFIRLLLYVFGPFFHAIGFADKDYANK
jgi:ubiquinone/menaquinone biosynthesis C-methylase UbiE/uncharacterized protein YbaR (Trm112 family)